MNNAHSRRCRTSLLVTTLLLLAGCASQGQPPATEPAPLPAATPEATKPAPEPIKSPSARKAENELSRGISAYENGDYKLAGQSLQQALELGLPSRIDQGRAYKHLAFIACASRQLDACKSNFRKGLAANPKLNLSKTEAGHPIWGPVFQQVKTEMTLRKKRPQ